MPQDSVFVTYSIQLLLKTLQSLLVNHIFKHIFIILLKYVALPFCLAWSIFTVDNLEDLIFRYSNFTESDVCTAEVNSSQFFFVSWQKLLQLHYVKIIALGGILPFSELLYVKSNIQSFRRHILLIADLTAL